MKSDTTAYITHPVAPHVKDMIRANGHRIVDARFAPEGAQIIDGTLGADAAAEPGPDINLTHAGIGKMKQAELLELLAAHGVEDTAGKTVADLRTMLIATVFIEG